jgi:hypothetical protein
MGKQSEIEKIGRVSSTSVKKCTGRSWRQWVTILDHAGARNWPHREINLLLKKSYKLTPWWQQGVAMGYEIHAGRRIEGRSEKGLYAMTASKAVPLNQKKAWALLSSVEGMGVWLQPFAPFAWKKGQGFEVDGGIFGEVRTILAPERLRISWKEEAWAKASVIQLVVIPRKGEKCIVVIQHESIPTESLKEKLRARWKESLSELVKLAIRKNG